MKDNFNKCLEIIFVHEGGFVDHPNDPGGMTNRGITKRTLEDYLGKQVTEDDMRNLSPDMAARIYKTRYWDGIKGDQLPIGLDLAVFDWAVNSGVQRAVKELQKILRVEDDGIIGPKTLAAIKPFDLVELINLFKTKRDQFYAVLIRIDPDLEDFHEGWLNRSEGTAAEAIMMLTDSKVIA